MKAIVFDGTDNKLVDGVTVRDPGIGEVQVRIVASGLCQSDLSVVNGKIPFPSPVILGHEGAGIVEAVGPGVTMPSVGDHVVLSTLATCGQCASCTSGYPTMCRESFGKTATPFELDGTPIHNFATLSTFTERIVVQAGQAVPIPKDIPLSTACLIGCAVLTGAGAVLNRARVNPGDSVVVIGAGGIGLNVIQALESQARRRLSPSTRTPTRRRRRASLAPPTSSMRPRAIPSPPSVSSPTAGPTTSSIASAARQSPARRWTCSIGAAS